MKEILSDGTEVDWDQQYEWSRIAEALKRFLLQHVTRNQRDAWECAQKLASMVQAGADARDLSEELAEWGFGGEGRSARILRLAKAAARAKRGGRPSDHGF